MKQPESAKSAPNGTTKDSEVMMGFPTSPASADSAAHPQEVAKPRGFERNLEVSYKYAKANFIGLDLKQENFPRLKYLGSANSKATGSLVMSLQCSPRKVMTANLLSCH